MFFFSLEYFNFIIIKIKRSTYFKIIYTHRSKCQHSSFKIYTYVRFCWLVLTFPLQTCERQDSQKWLYRLIKSTSKDHLILSNLLPPVVCSALPLPQPLPPPPNLTQHALPKGGGSDKMVNKKQRERDRMTWKQTESYTFSFHPVAWSIRGLEQPP